MKLLARIALVGAIFGAAHAAEPVKIGVIMPLTGAYGPLGVETLAGVRAATEVVNGQGGINGRPIELIVRDDATSPPQSVIAFKDLSGQGVVGVIGSLSSNSAVATVPLAEAAKLPYVGTATAEEQYEPLRDHVFIATVPMAAVSEALLRYLSVQKKRKIAVVYDAKNAFALNGWTHMQRLGPKYGVSIASSQEITSTATDFSTVLARLRQSDAEAVMFWGIGSAAVSFTKQYQTNGPKVPLLMSTGQASVNRYVKPSGPAAEGVIVATLLSDIGEKLPASPIRTSYDTLSKVYRAATGESVTGFAANGAGALMIMAEAVRAAGPDPAAMQKAMNAMVLASPYGFYRFSPTRHFGLGPEEVVITQVKNGDFLPTEWSLSTLEKALTAR